MDHSLLNYPIQFLKTIIYVSIHLIHLDHREVLQEIQHNLCNNKPRIRLEAIKVYGSHALTKTGDSFVLI